MYFQQSSKYKLFIFHNFFINPKFVFKKDHINERFVYICQFVGSGNETKLNEKKKKLINEKKKKNIKKLDLIISTDFFAYLDGLFLE